MIVVDASVLVTAVSDAGPAGNRAMTRIRGAGDAAAIPDFADLEATSALRGLWLGGAIPEHAFERAISALQALPIRRRPALPLLPRVFALRHNVSAYDAVYIALAERLGYTLVTADGRLARAPGIRCPVELLTDPA